MFDCGLHPAYKGIYALPFFDVLDPAEIDLILISHCHIDHWGSLPYFTTKTDFKGKVVMTLPTKAIFSYIVQDYIRLSDCSSSEILFDELDWHESMKNIIPIRIHEELYLEGVKIKAYNAGHVLGAAMFLVEIEGVKIFYTGDYSREPDRHLKPAEIPDTEIDILIVESTYGTSIHEPRYKREDRFKATVLDTVCNKQGKWLLPVYALGRAQEILMLLNEFFQEHECLKNIPIHISGSLARKSLNILKTYKSVMGEYLK